jgi:hypothetical protein
MGPYLIYCLSWWHCQVINDVPLSGPPVGAGSDTQQQVDQNQPGIVRRKAAIPYETIVYTGDKYGAGTDALIQLAIRGTGGLAAHTFDQVCVCACGGRQGGTHNGCVWLPACLCIACFAAAVESWTCGKTTLADC